MKEKMISFLHSIGIDNYQDFDIDFDMVARDRFDKNQINMSIVKETPWKYYQVDQIQNGLTKVDYKCNVQFSYLTDPSIEDTIELFKDWYQTLYRVPFKYSISNVEGRVTISFPNEEEQLSNKQVIEDFNDFLKFLNYDFEVFSVVEEVLNISKKELHKIDKEAVKFAEKDNIELEAEPDTVNKNDVFEKIEEERQHMSIEVGESILQVMERNKREMEKERERVRRNKRGDYQPIDNIDDITPESNGVDFSATIHKIETKDFPRGGTKLTLGVHDNNGGAIYVSMFENNQVNADFVKKLTVRTNIRIRGVAYLDEYTKQLTIKCHMINLLPPDEIVKDEYEQNRVELHLHSTMSNQDGVTKMSDYCAYASALGHKALAITDHGVVQAFPDAQNAAKKYGLKMLYGCELYVVDDELQYVFNPSDRLLSKTKYVVLDLETTGLNSRYDKIIEFGAVRAERGKAQQSLDILINPERKLEKNISRITNITDEMLADKPVISKVLQQILDFIGDSILVTHNANFDFSFLQQALIDNGFEPLKNPVIDTLALSRYLFPESRNHTLGALCSNMEVNYDTESAHRADYDATVLNDVWQPMLDKLLKDNPNLTHQDLTKLVAPKELTTRLRPFHVVALCKNKEGLKDLYKIVSFSHIDYFSELPTLKVPTIPRRILSQYRNNLLLGSACFNGEVFETAKYYNLDRIMKVMDFYDYIEVQPLDNYSYLVNMGEMSENAVITCVKDIIEAADKCGKPVCATGDVHYLTPKDKLFRDVYIASQSVGGIWHALNPYSRRKGNLKFDNPNQHYRSTKEMLDAFSFLGEEKAKEIVITNTNMIADSIESIMPAPNDKLYKPHLENCEENLTKLCYDRAHEIYGDPLPKLIQNRLDRELKGVLDNGYSVVYMISHKIVKKATDDGYIIGSRGSVGSSFLATMAGITEVNPLPPHYVCPHCKKVIWGKDIHPECKSGYDLPDMICPDCGTKMINDGQNIPFETFLGFNADKVPDIDLNFPGDYRDRAYDYTKELLGKDNCFRAGTIGTVAEKTAFGFARGYIERKFISEGCSEEEAKTKLDGYSKAKLDYLASGCADVRRTTGQHPGGVVVIPNDYEIYDFTPIQYPADDNTESWKTTHFDFESIHDTLLKLDMLGHDDPIALKMMCDLTGIPLHSIPLNDKKVLSLFSSSHALELQRDYLANKTGAMGLPEFGTENTRRILETTSPKTFTDLVIISGLSHGTGVWAGNAEDLIKSGKTLSDVIGCRDDIMTYLMSKDIESSTAFNIMETVRKKDKYLNETQIDVMKAHGVPQFYIDSCNKIEYMFPKGHACAYCIMAVRVGYFKVYHPLEFYATFFTVRSEQFEIATMVAGEAAIIKRLDELKLKGRGKEKLSTKEEGIQKTLQIALEMYERGIKFSNIDLYKSDSTKFVVDHESNSIIPPFRALDGLGENNAISVIEERKISPFTSIDNLLKRTKLSQTNVGDLKSLHVLDDLPNDDQISLFDF